MRFLLDAEYADGAATRNGGQHGAAEATRPDKRGPRARRGGLYRRSGQTGLTLVELLVVLAILAMVATLAAPRAMRYLGYARGQTTKTQINNLVSAVELYYLDVSDYPPQASGLKALLEAPDGVVAWNGPYIRPSKAIVDPWGRPYVYRFPGEQGTFDIFSLGKDGKPGGEGEDQDVTSW